MKEKAVSIQLKNEEISNGFAIRKRVIKHDYPLHFHDFFEFEYILSGTGTTIINNIPYEIQKGSLIFVTPLDFQNINITESLEVLNFNFSDFWIDNSIIHYCESSTVLQNIPDTFFIKMYEEFEGGRFQNETIIRNLLNCILVDIIRQNIPHYDKKLTDITFQIAHYIRTNCHNNISLEMLSKKFGYTPNYMSSLFKKNFNKTIKQYIIETRLDRSIKMLASSKISVTDVCYEAGFCSLSNFLRTFKSVYGITPKEYRMKNSLQKNN